MGRQGEDAPPRADSGFPEDSSQSGGVAEPTVAETYVAAARPSAPAQPQLPLSEHNRATLGELERALALSTDFVLLFARANLPVLRDALIADLARRETVEGRSLRRVDLAPGDNVLRALLQAAADFPTPDSLHVSGLERSMPYGEPYPDVLSNLNLVREHFRRVPCPVVFWLREDALIRLIGVARCRSRGFGVRP